MALLLVLHRVLLLEGVVYRIKGASKLHRKLGRYLFRYDICVVHET